MKKLFADYDPLERPVENEYESLEVKVGMAIQQVVDLDEKMQVLRSSGWMDYVSHYTKVISDGSYFNGILFLKGWKDYS